MEPQFPHEDALEQFLVGWCPLQRLQNSRFCFFLIGLTNPDSSKTRNPGRGALVKIAIHVLCGAAGLFCPYSFRRDSFTDVALPISSEIIDLLTSYWLSSVWVYAGTVGIITGS